MIYRDFVSLPILFTNLGVQFLFYFIFLNYNQHYLIIKIINHNIIKNLQRQIIYFDINIKINVTHY